ncbi:MAG: SRPBCC family protein [Bacteroidota bacterium]
MRLLSILFLSIITIDNMYAQSTKKQRQVIAERTVQLPADQVWHILAEDYGAIANSHPTIVKSEYASGTLTGGEGAERVCYFNEKGTQMFHEKITKWEPEKMSFTQVIKDYKKFPIDKDNTAVVYSVESIDARTSKIKANLMYRTKPAFMGGMAKGKFKGMLEDYFLAIEHHIKTGEQVTVDNFKTIKKQYKS